MARRAYGENKAECGHPLLSLAGRHIMSSWIILSINNDDGSGDIDCAPWRFFAVIVMMACNFEAAHYYSMFLALFLFLVCLFQKMFFAALRVVIGVRKSKT